MSESKRRKARRPISASRFYRERRAWKRLVSDAQSATARAHRELSSARTTIEVQGRRLKDLTALFQTGEAYYRAQRIIADLLADKDAAISADLKQDILAALYHGVSRRWVGEARSYGSSTDVEVLKLSHE